MGQGHAWADLPVLLSGPGVEIRGFDAQGMTTALIRLEAGFDARPVFKGLPGDHCQVPHWGYVISGKLKLWLQDGTCRSFNPGEVFTWEPGHAPAADEDTEYVELSPSADYRELMRHVTGG